MTAEHVFSGAVLQGRHLGRQLGFPTVNIALDSLPEGVRNGVYVSAVTVPGGATYRAVTNIGVRPTVDDTGELFAEAHLIDYQGDLYGETVTVVLGPRLRDERRFASVAALRAEVRRNIDQARLSGWQPSPRE